MSDGHETMTDDALEKALLRTARDYGASERARHGTMDALGLAAIAPAAQTSFWKLHGLKLALSALLLGAAGLFLLHRDEAPRPATAAVAPLATTPPVTTVAAVTPEPETLAQPSAAPPQPLSLAPMKLPVRARPATPAPAPTSTLAEEIASIDRVRQAVYAKDKEAALRGLDDYDRRFPNGALAPEAQLLRTRASALP